jgi:hypothetical protein
MHPLAHLRSLPRPVSTSDIGTGRVPSYCEGTLSDFDYAHCYIVRMFADVPAAARG